MYGANRFKEIFEKNKSRPLLLYGDPDFDGLVSLLLMCQFADMFGLQYKYHVNDKRFHGFELKPEDLKGYLVISADFTIQKHEIERLVNNDVVILSTDHHECQKEFIDVVGETAEGIVINNQYPFEPEDNRYQSGAGVFYELICELYPEFKSREREELVGITLLTDIREIENPKAREYLKKTYTADTEKGYAHYLVSSVSGNDFSYGVPKLDRNFIDYNLSPFVNSLLRFDKKDKAVDFILGKGLDIKNQSGIQKELLDVMMQRLRALELSSLSVIYVNALGFLDYPNVTITSFIGLLCSKYKDTHNNKSCIGLVIENGEVTRASFRGRYSDVHYRVGFRNLGITAEGHPAAFGILNFFPEKDTWIQLDDLIRDLEAMHSSTIKVIETSNLAIELLNNGMKYANENCYCRDMYRTYIKYTGSNYKIVKTTYKTVEFTEADYKAKLKPDKVIDGVSYKYSRDKDGNLVPKYIEYSVDGRTVKSFGVSIEEGLLLPMLENGYINIYINGNVA